MNAFEEGYQAHRDHAIRTTNPYVTKAANWDAGWIKRQKEQLEISGKTKNISRIISFRDFFIRNSK